jgi:tRNA-binding EMAP/Myf-like protein
MKIIVSIEMDFKEYLYNKLKRYETSLKMEEIIIIEEKEKDMKDLIEFDEFIEIEKKLEIKIGKVTAVEDVPKSKKLIKLTVDFGTETRTVVTNIKPLLNPTDDLIATNLQTSLGFAMSIVNKSFAFITNLKPVTMMGIESTAMILPGEIEMGDVITINGLVKPGTKLL